MGSRQFLTLCRLLSILLQHGLYWAILQCDLPLAQANTTAQCDKETRPKMCFDLANDLLSSGVAGLSQSQEHDQAFRLPVTPIEKRKVT